MARPTTLPGDNRLSSRERHPSRPCPEGTFLDSPGFVRSTTLGCGPVRIISPEGAGLIIVPGENVGENRPVSGVRGQMLRLFQSHPASSEPRWGSGACWMSPTQGSRCASTLGYGRFPLQGMAGADGCASWSCGDFRLDELGAPPQATAPMGSHEPWIGQEPPAGRSASTPPALAARWRASGPSPPRGGRRSPKGG